MGRWKGKGERGKGGKEHACINRVPSARRISIVITLYKQSKIENRKSNQVKSPLRRVGHEGRTRKEKTTNKKKRGNLGIRYPTQHNRSPFSLPFSPFISSHITKTLPLILPLIPTSLLPQNTKHPHPPNSTHGLKNSPSLSPTSLDGCFSPLPNQPYIFHLSSLFPVSKSLFPFSLLPFPFSHLSIFLLPPPFYESTNLFIYLALSVAYWLVRYGIQCYGLVCSWSFFFFFFFTAFVLEWNTRERMARLGTVRGRVRRRVYGGIGLFLSLSTLFYAGWLDIPRGHRRSNWAKRSGSGYNSCAFRAASYPC